MLDLLLLAGFLCLFVAFKMQTKANQINQKKNKKTHKSLANLFHTSCKASLRRMTSGKVGWWESSRGYESLQISPHTWTFQTHGPSALEMVLERDRLVGLCSGKGFPALRSFVEKIIAAIVLQSTIHFFPIAIAFAYVCTWLLLRVGREINFSWENLINCTFCVVYERYIHSMHLATKEMNWLHFKLALKASKIVV